MNDDQEFLAALSAFQSSPPKQIEFRIYYDRGTGKILNYTTDDQPGDFIVVDRETFAKHRFDCTIRDGKIVPYKLPIGKLVPGQKGISCHPKDICIVVDQEPALHWSMKTYED